MEPVTIHPHATTFRDALLLVGWTGALTLIFYGVMGTRWLLNREVLTSIPGRRATEDGLRGTSLTEDQMSRLLRFHFSGPTFLLGCVPMAVIVVGSLGCALLRDAGYQIYPWPVVLNGAASGIAVGLVPVIRRRHIRRLLQQPAT